MQPITWKQISELPDKEQRQLQAWINNDLGKEYAAQQRRKQVMTERMKTESEVQDELCTS